MPMIVLLPWCRIDQRYTVGQVEVLPFERRGRSGSHIPSTNRTTARQISRLMSPYRDLEGHRIEEAVVVKWERKSSN